MSLSILPIPASRSQSHLIRDLVIVCQKWPTCCCRPTVGGDLGTLCLAHIVIWWYKTGSKRIFGKKWFLSPQRHPRRFGHFKWVKRRQKVKFWKLAQNSPKSAKRIKQKYSAPFWGDFGIKKWSRFFWVGTQSAIFLHLKTGTFAKSARFQVTKNGTSGAETKKPRPLFNANIPPKWWLARLFCPFITFGCVLSQFWKFCFLGPFSPFKWPNRKKITYMGRNGPRAKTKTVLKPVRQWEKHGSMPKSKF